MPKIKKILSHKILNSRGDWTIETDVLLEDGSVGSQAVPEGASKGENEAISLSADKAVELVNTVINDALDGEEALEQQALDEVLIQMDGTPNKSHLGGNSILSVSLALAKACAVSKKLDLYQYLSLLFNGKVLEKSEIKAPTPVFNILNGGKHARNGLSFQEFMLIPSKSMKFSDCLRCAEITYHNLKQSLETQGFSTGVGDEGGFAPMGFTAEKAFSEIKKAAGKNYRIGKEVFFGMDAASESFYESEKYNLKEERLSLDNTALCNYYTKLLKKFEIIYLEDPFYEKDLRGWEQGYKAFADKLMLVADDLVVTNINFLQIAMKKSLANAVIIKPNQVGTLTETFAFIKKAQEGGLNTVVSHRSGDTAEDTFISDLAIAVKADFIKSGAPVRGERVAKYNRILNILNSAA